MDPKSLWPPCCTTEKYTLASGSFYTVFEKSKYKEGLPVSSQLISLQWKIYDLCISLAGCYINEQKEISGTLLSTFNVHLSSCKTLEMRKCSVSVLQRHQPALFSLSRPSFLVPRPRRLRQEKRAMGTEMLRAPCA